MRCLAILGMKCYAGPMDRDEEWERSAAIDHAWSLIELLRKGQNVDADPDSTGNSLRGWLKSLRTEIDRAIGKD